MLSPSAPFLGCLSIKRIPFSSTSANASSIPSVAKAMWWMLAREVLRMRGTISREHPWEVMPDLYFYRDPEEIEKEEQAAAEKAVTKEEFQGEWTAPAPEFTAAQPEVADWSEGVQVPSVPIQQFPTEDWSAQPATEDWSAAPTAQATEWVGATTEWS